MALLTSAAGAAEIARTPLEPDVVVTTRSGSIGARALGSGWGRPEANHVWSVGPYAELALVVPAIAAGGLWLRLRGGLVEDELSIKIRVNGVERVERRIGADEPRSVTIDVPVSSGATREPMVALLGLSSDRTVRPVDVGHGRDERELAFALQSFELRWYAFPSPRRDVAMHFSAAAGAGRCREGGASATQPARGEGPFAVAGLGSFRRSFDKRADSFGPIFVDDHDLQLPLWAPSLATLGAAAIVIASEERAAIVFPDGAGASALWCEVGAEAALAVLAETYGAPALLVAWSAKQARRLTREWEAAFTSSKRSIISAPAGSIGRGFR